MADLRQILSQGRKRIGLMVGAGAPMSIKINLHGKIDVNGVPLIPGVDELTKLVITGLKDKKERDAVQELSRSIGPSVNIEKILSQIRLLERALGNVNVHGLNSNGYSALGRNICDQIGGIVGARLPKERNAYNDLVAWISGTLRVHAVEIFSANYDLLFEEAFESARAPYFDGSTGGASPFFDAVTVASDDLPPRWSRLWKLHGSIGWALERDRIVRGGGRNSTHLIFPDHLKYDLTQKQPYSALFERLRQFLLNPDTLLLATGFSFRDAHISAVIEEALAMNSNAAAIAFQYSDLDREEAACTIASDRPNLSVYAADGAVINGVVGKWRPGETNKNWADIRPTFWAPREVNADPCFLLGDFCRFTNFCALSQAEKVDRVKLDSPQREGSPEIIDD
ncbi:SIR2 family NAD-dependent protein deacylase [Rhodoplanes roseus]|nr:SIR2 family protein [Rhodoplanes roseus]